MEERGRLTALGEIVELLDRPAHFVLVTSANTRPPNTLLMRESETKERAAWQIPDWGCDR